MNPSTLRHSLVAGTVCAGAVGLIGLVQALRTGAPFPGFVQPLLVFTVLAGTVGALVGPLLGRALVRLRGGRDDEEEAGTR